MVAREKRNLLYIFFIFLIFAGFHFQAWADEDEEYGEEEEDEMCFECETKINTSLGLIKEMIASREPLKIDKNVLPCSFCDFVGVKSLEPNNRVCPTKGQDGNLIYFDHYIEMRFVEIIIRCQCKLSSNPKTLSDEILEKISKVMKDLESQQQGEEKLEFTSVAELQEKFCPEIDGSDELEGVVEASWPNVVMGIVLRAWKKSNQIETVKVSLLSKDAKLIPKCGDSSTPFYKSCDCLLGINYPFLVFGEVMNGMFPKEGENANAKENAEMLSMLTCLDTLADVEEK